MSEVDLYNYGRRYRRNLEVIEGDKLICKENKKDITSFAKMRLAKGSGYGRVAKVLYCLRNLAIWIKKPFREATKDDLVALIGDLETHDYSEHTKYDYKIVLKLFYKWLKGNDETVPNEVKWLKPKLKNGRHKLPEDLITEDEVMQLVEAAEHPRDKAIVLVLYESGCRIGELLSLKMQNVKFDQYGAVLILHYLYVGLAALVNAGNPESGPAICGLLHQDIIRDAVLDNLDNLHVAFGGIEQHHNLAATPDAGGGNLNHVPGDIRVGIDRGIRPEASYGIGKVGEPEYRELRLI